MSLGTHGEDRTEGVRETQVVYLQLSLGLPIEATAGAGSTTSHRWCVLEITLPTEREGHTHQGVIV